MIGHENAGWIHAVGDGVTNVAVGDTVILHPQPPAGCACRAGRGKRHAVRERLLPRPREQRRRHGRVPAHHRPACIKLDPSTNPADVAALADAGITAYHAVRKAVPGLYPGTTAVVQGAGGLGHIAIQALAAITGTRIVVVDRNPDALALAKQIGADETVLSDGSHVDAVKDLTNGNGRRRGVRLRGRAGRRDRRLADDRARPDRCTSSATAASSRSRRSTSSAARRTSSATSSAPTPTSSELMVLAQAGKVTLHTKQYPLDAALDALHDLDAGRVRGRAILVP